jgi:hypothetical protein
MDTGTAAGMNGAAALVLMSFIGILIVMVLFVMIGGKDGSDYEDIPTIKKGPIKKNKGELK